MGTIREGYEDEIELEGNIYNTTDMFSVLHYYREFKTKEPNLPSLMRKNDWDEIPVMVFEELDEIIEKVLKDRDSMKRVDTINRSWNGGPDITFLLEDPTLEKALKFVSREVYLREGSGEYDRAEAGEFPSTGHVAQPHILDHVVFDFGMLIEQCTEDRGAYFIQSGSNQFSPAAATESRTSAVYKSDIL